MDVSWHVTHNIHSGSPNGPILESYLYTERTLYRWPDSWKRIVQRDDIPGNENKLLKRFDENNVIEGIQPDGTHARRSIELPQGELMNGPKLIDSLPKEMVRAPFLLARWLIDDGFDRNDLDIQQRADGSIDGLCQSAGLGFLLSHDKDGGYYLSHATMLSPKGVHLVEYEMSDPVRQDGLPGAIASKIRVSLLHPDGTHSPAPPLDLISARAVTRPSDNKMYINFENVAVQDRRTGKIMLSNKQEINYPAVKPSRQRVSMIQVLRIAGIGFVVVAGGVWWYRRRYT